MSLEPVDPEDLIDDAATQSLIAVTELGREAYREFVEAAKMAKEAKRAYDEAAKRYAAAVSALSEAVAP